MHTKYITGYFGAEILDIDLSKHIKQTDRDDLSELLVKNKVLIFKNQDISPEQHRDFAKIFGKPEEHYYYKTPPGVPEVSILESGKDDSTTDNIWHSDGSYRKTPPLGSALYSRVIPEAGGDTIWADMEAAYDALSDKMKAFVGSLSAVHDVTGGYGKTLLQAGEEKLKKVQEKLPPVIHPVVATHPVSKRKSLFVSSSYTTHISDMSRHESDGILKLLFRHLLTPEFQMRHQWEENTMIVWDNRSLTHYAVDDYRNSYRKMHRVSIVT